jgi:hypothetical protein
MVVSCVLLYLVASSYIEDSIGSFRGMERYSADPVPAIRNRYGEASTAILNRTAP